MGVVLTNILAQIPYYGTPLARQWGGEDVSETPLFDAYVAAVGNDRDNLLLWGHTGWFGGTPFIHRDSRVRAARITAPKQSEEPPTDLEGKAVRQLRASLKDNDTLGVLDAISRLGHIGTERTQMVLYEIAGNHLNRRRLEIMIKRGDDLAAYVRSMIGLHALQALVPSSGFRFAVRILKDIVLGSKGIAVFPEQE
ncbi:MAG: hypothetical protein U1D33_04270, partial [bacterium]|nr:hypothetical protein [bacterium]